MITLHFYAARGLAAILGMAALLISAPPELEMVCVHLLEPFAAGNVPWARC